MTTNKANPLIFGAELTRQRRKRGLTQAELGTIIGLKPQYISMLETGKREAGMTTILALSRALGIHPGLLLDGYVANSEECESDRGFNDFPSM